MWTQTCMLLNKNQREQCLTYLVWSYAVVNIAENKQRKKAGARFEHAKM